MDELKSALRERKVLIPLIVILVLGAFLRFYGIENQSLSNDELSSWKRSGYDDLATVVEEGARPDVHPPGYYLLLFFVQKMFGDSEAALRFPSALFGVLSILIIFLIGLRLYSYREALLAAALTAVLWCPVFYSQDARPYAMLLFFTLLSSYCWIPMVETLKSGSPRRGPLIAYAITAALCAYTHYFGTYIIALQGVFTVILFIRRRSALIAVLIVYAAITVVFLPWLPVMREHLARGPIWITTPHGGFVHWFLTFVRFLFNDSRTVGNIAVALLLLLFARSYGEFAAEPTRLRTKRLLLSPGAVLLLWLVVPFAGVYLESLHSTPVLSVRNLIISLPPACLLLARAVTRLPLKGIVRTAVLLLVPVLLLSHLIFAKDYYSRSTKHNFKSAVRYLLENRRIDRCPLIIANTNQDGYFDYYLRRLGADRRVDMQFRSREDWPAVKSLIDARRAPCAWYLLGSDGEKQQHYHFRKEGFELVEKEYFYHTEVRLYAKPSPQKNQPLKESRTRITGSGVRLVPKEEAETAPRRIVGKGVGPAQTLWDRAMKQTTPEDKIRFYRAILERYPDDDLAPQALYMIGFIYSEEMRDTLKAQNALEDLLIRYPESNLVESARWLIKDLSGELPPIEFTDEEE